MQQLLLITSVAVVEHTVCAQLCCSCSEHTVTPHQHTIQAAGMKSVWKKDQVTTSGRCSSSSSSKQHMFICCCEPT
jgi:hypothetical protein